MSYRYMRMVLFFDLPTLELKHQRAYRLFLKNLKKNGFYMLQESVYVKMALNQQVVDSTMIKIKEYVPAEGSVLILTITEKQFSSMKILLGEVKSDVVTSDERVLII